MYTKEELHSIFKSLYDKQGGRITIEQVCNALGTCQRTLHKNILAVNAYEDCPDVFMHIRATTWKNATQSLYQLKIGTGNKYENMLFLYEQFYANQKIILTRKQQAFYSMLV